jgi:Glycosyl transferase family 11
MGQPWVAGNLTGGIGNRLFQHAAAAGYAERFQRQLVFALGHCGPKEHGPVENIFKLFPEVPVLTESVKPTMLQDLTGYIYIPFDAPTDNAPRCIDGYRQSEKYFPSGGIWARLEECVSTNRQQELFSKYGLIQKEKTWFVHLRFGDYTILPHHQINLISYYKPAMERVPADANILVFSDEATKYKNIIQKLFTWLGRTVTIVEEDDELESLFLMSQCWGGAVVANSTFSWWGAYFAHQRSPGPYVAMYPTIWGQGMPEARDIIPSWGTPIANPL